MSNYASIGVIILLGAVLRSYKWLDFSLWYDEAQWLIVAGSGTFQRLSHDAALIAKPPLFGILLHFWRFAGNKEAFLRVLPCVFGIVAIYLVYRTGLLLLDRQTALAAAALTALSPIHIHYSQEVSHYTLTVLLFLCAIYFLLKAFACNRNGYWILFCVCSAAALYTNFAALALIPVETAFFLSSGVSGSRTARKWIYSQFFLMALLVCYYFSLNRQIPCFTYARFNEQMLWMSRGNASYFRQMFGAFDIGYTAYLWGYRISSILFLFLFCAGIIGTIRARKTSLTMLLTWALLPVLAGLSVSRVIPVFTYRNFLIVLPAYYLLLAAGINYFRRMRIVIWTLIVILCSVSLVNYYGNRYPCAEVCYRPGVHPRMDNKGASKYVLANIQAGDIVKHTCYSTVTPFIYYRHAFSGGKGVKLTLSARDHILKKQNASFPDSLAGHKRLWLLFASWEYPPGVEEMEVRRILDGKYKLLSSRHFSGLDVLLYDLR